MENIYESTRDPKQNATSKQAILNGIAPDGGLYVWPAIDTVDLDLNAIVEQSYIENILRLNKGKKVRVHMTFPDSNEFRDREFVGIIEQSGRDHIILSEPSTGKWQLLLMIYVDFISFDEPINYSPEFIPGN